MDSPLISVIVPVYKVEKYLDRCLESIVNQTYTNLEIILVDDGSPDNCPQMCDDWASKDSRIKVIHKENNGVAEARNCGLDSAKGELIGFVDSDDWTEPNLFETLLDNLISHNADISVCGYQINTEEDVEADTREVEQADALKLIAQGYYKYGVLWNKLYRKDVTEGVKMPPFACSEDLVFNYFAFKNNSKKIVECNSKLYHYFQNQESTVHGKFSKGAFDAVYAKEIILENEKKTEIEKYAIKGLINSCFVVLSGCIQNDMFTEESNSLIEIIKKHKKEIFTSVLYSNSQKLKTFLLCISKKAYIQTIKRIH